MYRERQEQFRKRMAEAGLDVALITDDDNLYYLTGYHDYLHMEFGRPTILAIPRDEPSLLITPTIDLNSARALARVDRISPWNDGIGDEWRAELPDLLGSTGAIGAETDQMPPIVHAFVGELADGRPLHDVSPILADLRMIKSPAELQIARHAGRVSMAMMAAGRDAIGDGVPEFEVALETSQAGARRAAALLAEHYPDGEMSPNTQFLQIMASGKEITKTHHRATTRVMRHGEPVFLCFCGMTNFHRFKLGHDRTFWIGEADPAQAKVYEVAVESQRAALAALGPGVTAESVHAEYAEVIQTAGYDYPFRCGRATGFSFLEKPQLIGGDTTILKPGMVFAVDGSVSTDTFRAQVGDSFIITDTGYEPLTEHPKALADVIL